MKKQLRKPENWQDFESLCKILWGEIWNCPEIKKNGRTGQKQHGVDVYGTPNGENEYYGIQCKGKDDYTNSTLTTSEIDDEIKKALNFKPILKKLYFVTTANKDVKIEEYVRLIDEKSRRSNGFEIHIFSWEDIVDLIDENKRTHDWYVNNIGFKVKHSVNITFGQGVPHIIFHPPLIKNHVSYRQKESKTSRGFNFPRHTPDYSLEVRIKQLYSPQPVSHYINGSTFNKTACVFTILVENDGNVPIENFKLYINFPNNGIFVDSVNKQKRILDSNQYSYNTIMYKDSNNFIFEPKEQILVQTDKISTDKLCLRPTTEGALDILVDYEFVAKDFNTKGQLTIRLESELTEKNSIEETETNREDEIRLENCFE